MIYRQKKKMCIYASSRGLKPGMGTVLPLQQVAVAAVSAMLLPQQRYCCRVCC